MTGLDGQPGAVRWDPDAPNRASLLLLLRGAAALLHAEPFPLYVQHPGIFARTHLLGNRTGRSQASVCRIQL